MLLGVYPEQTAEILLPRLRDQDDSTAVLSDINSTVDGFSLLRFEFCDLPFDLFFRICQR